MLSLEGQKVLWQGFQQQSLYLSAHLGNPFFGHELTTVNAPGYARVEIPDSGWTIDATTGLISNNATFSFPQATGDWPTPTHYGLYDGMVGGNLILPFEAAAATAALTIVNGDTLRVLTGSLTASLASVFGADHFTDTAATELTAHTPAFGGSWVENRTALGSTGLQIDANGRLARAGASAAFVMLEAGPAIVHQRAEWTARRATGSSVDGIGVLLRFGEGDGNDFGYLIEHASGTIQLKRYTASGFSAALGMATLAAWAEDTDLELQADVMDCGTSNQIVVSAGKDIVFDVNDTDADRPTVVGGVGVWCAAQSMVGYNTDAIDDLIFSII